MIFFKKAFLFLCLFLSTAGHTQFTYPIDMEGTYGVGEVFQPFGGSIATVVANPDPSGWNTSPNVLRINKGAQVWAGMEFRFAVPIPAGSFGAAGTAPNFCFDYYTTAPAGYEILFKFGNGANIDQFQTATVSGEWGQVCYTPSAGNNGATMPVIIFRLGTGGNTSDPNFTLYVDNLMYYADADVPVLPLSFTTDSEYFCDSPGEEVTFTYTQGLGGPYNWFTDPACGTSLGTGVNYTTPVLTEEQAYYVQDESAIVASGSRQVGPLGSGTPLNGFSTTGSQFFRSNMANGSFLDAVRMRQHVPAGGPAGGCVFTAQAINITQGITSSVTMNGGSTNNTDIPFNFLTSGSTGALPMNYCDELELRISTSSTGCYVTQTASGGQNLFLPFPNETDPELTFTSATYNAGVSSGNHFMGTNYWIRGNLLAPRVQVNALLDCAIALPIELLYFEAKPINNFVQINWETASERDNNYFLIERSRDGFIFDSLFKVDGAGNSITPISYEKIDHSPLNGLSYYRMKQVDYNGAFSYSDISSVFIANNENFYIYPNPSESGEAIQLGVDLSFDYPASVEIIDMTGKIIYSDILTSNTLDCQLQSGIYILRVFNGGDQLTTKMVVK